MDANLAMKSSHSDEWREDVSDDDAERQFKQRDGVAQLDREHRGEEHDGSKYGCELDGTHADLLLRVCSDVR